MPCRLVCSTAQTIFACSKILLILDVCRASGNVKQSTIPLGQRQAIPVVLYNNTKHSPTIHLPAAVAAATIIIKINFHEGYFGITLPQRG